MLKIVKCGFRSGGDRIKREILSRTEKEKKTLLIVPEQQTLIAEGEMADLLPEFSPLFFEVTNFTRLANTTARALGGISGEYCDNTKKALFMWRTLTELSPILSSTAAGVNEGLVSRYLNASANLDSQGISADMLSLALESEFISDERLRRKLADLAAVHSLYKKLLCERYGDSQNECAQMHEKLRENPEYLSDSAVYIDGFISFTETQYAIISDLAKRCEVTVTLYISHACGDSFEYTEVRGTLDRLKKAAALADTELKIFTDDSRRENDIISLAADLIWRTNKGFDNLSLQNAENIRIFEAETPFDECEFIASDIKRRVMDGAHYADFAVVARNTDKYLGVLDSTLALSEIPAFISNPKSVSCHEAIKLIFSAYAVIRSGYSRDSVISYAKCGFAGITRDECDLFEHYTEKWQITGSRFTCGEDFAMNPDGFTEKWSSKGLSQLEKINDIKDRLIGPLLDFQDEAGRAKTVREEAEALYNHLTALNLPKGLSDKAKELLEFGEAAHAEETARIWQTVCTALDTLVTVSGDTPSDPDSFLGQLRVAFDNTSLSKIPSYVDQVTVGCADMLRLSGKKHIYLIGVNAGEFPSVATDNAYFTEADKSALSKAGLSLDPDLELRGARELYLFARSFTWGEESVTLSYAVRDNSFKAKERSDVIEKLVRVFGGTLSVNKISAMPADARLYSARSTLVGISSLSESFAKAAEDALSKAGHGELLRLSSESITNENMALDPSLAAGIYKDDIYLSQTKMDNYLNCPFGYFCRYTLNLSGEEQIEFDARNIGTFIHAILENVLRELTYEKRFDEELSEEERVEIVTRAAKEYLNKLGEQSLSSARTRIKINRLVRAAMPVVDGLCEEFAESKFRPRFFELAIKRNTEGAVEPMPSGTFGERNIYLTGYIDRVDSYVKDGNAYIRVVDYKTGRKLFSPDDIKKGTNLQMFLYLKALLEEEREEFRTSLGVGEGGRVIPAGVIYVNTSINDVKVERPDDELAKKAVKAAQGREGMMLDDEEIALAMGLRYTPFYSVKTGKAPDNFSKCDPDYRFTEESLSEIFDDCMDMTEKVAGGIVGGNIKAVPKIQDDGETYCDTCDYKTICRKAVIG